MKQKAGRPYADTRLVKFLERRISDLRSTKTQIKIAAESGFRSPNMMSMVKHGSTKLPLDRVLGLAKALDCDPASLFRMAIEQSDQNATSQAIDQIFGAIITDNEAAWLKCIRQASNDSDPSLTARAEKAIRAIFGK